MSQQAVDRIARALAAARKRREKGAAAEQAALDDIATLARDGLDERMTKSEIARHAGITRNTLDEMLRRQGK
jgi:DNA-binding transcriptional regulator LsrR (DeoR family)